jgi:hypothetical protein
MSSTSTYIGTETHITLCILNRDTKHYSIILSPPSSRRSSIAASTQFYGRSCSTSNNHLSVLKQKEHRAVSVLLSTCTLVPQDSTQAVRQDNTYECMVYYIHGKATSNMPFKTSSLPDMEDMHPTNLHISSERQR